jgi:hypothetical protein
MLVKVLSGAILGIDAYIVEVEVDIAQGLPVFATVGLFDGLPLLPLLDPGPSVILRGADILGFTSDEFAVTTTRKSLCRDDHRGPAVGFTEPLMP